MGWLHAFGAFHNARDSLFDASALALELQQMGVVHVELPLRMHPWTFHNLAFWLLDTPNARDGLVLRSASDGTNPAYSLVRDPDMGDCMCGVDADGTGWRTRVRLHVDADGRPGPFAARSHSPVCSA